MSKLKMILDSTAHLLALKSIQDTTGLTESEFNKAYPEVGELAARSIMLGLEAALDPTSGVINATVDECVQHHIDQLKGALGV